MKIDNKELIHSILSWLGALFVPIVLILTFIRLLLTPIFVQIEYRLPTFPEDSYGFSVEERLAGAQIALDYLLNDADISFLGDLTFDDGSAFYKDSELSHMLDVKTLVQFALQVWLILLTTFVALGFWAWRANRLPLFRRMLSNGGQLTVLLLVSMLVYLGINFNRLFTQFHEIFFEGDSWVFLYSDTLIRLFPIPFWRDAFIVLGLLTILSGGLLWYFLGWRYKKSSEVSEA